MYSSSSNWPHTAISIAAVFFALAGGATSASATPYLVGRYPVLPFRHVSADRRHILRHYPVNRAFERGQYQNGTWQPLTAPAPFGKNGAGTAMLMTDGTAMVSDNDTKWYRLTPDQTGSYINGTWSEPSKLPSGYGPLAFASAVLPDGRLIVEGGEFNLLQQNPAETNLGAIYDPVANAWQSVAPPQGWPKIGDAQSAVLSDGTFMLGTCCAFSEALLDSQNLTWATTGTSKNDANDEEGWTLLPDGTLLTVDVFKAPNSERYDPSTGSWSSAGSTPNSLVTEFEIGPQVLRPNGTVFVAGATGHTAIYSTAKGKWSAGPDFPVISGSQLDIADGPGALMPNGRVLLAANPGIFNSPAYFFEFDGKQLLSVPAPPNAPNDDSSIFRFLVLPTGQVLETDASDDVEVYTPSGKAPRRLRPQISAAPTTVTRGSTYAISGIYLNGWSQASMYGDDAQMATNYPLVRITNDATGHVLFARTHDHSSMAVASSATVTTNFDVPKEMERGASRLVVVANGIASDPVRISVR